VAKVREYEESLKDREAGIKAAVKYCVEQNVLADFLKKNASEVMNMLLTEWNWDDALAVRYEEGIEEGREEGRMEGRMEGCEEIAKNALRAGAAVEFVQKITGLDTETITRLASST
jgi:predicted transposase/invertase (TIGR01784 family)